MMTTTLRTDDYGDRIAIDICALGQDATDEDVAHMVELLQGLGWDVYGPAVDVAHWDEDAEHEMDFGADWETALKIWND